MSHRIPELLYEIRSRSIAQGKESVDMTDYLTGLNLQKAEVYNLLRALNEKNWIRTLPEQNAIDMLRSWDQDALNGLSMALLPEGLIFLETREREHEMMSDIKRQTDAAATSAREAAKANKGSWIMAIVAAVSAIAAIGAWLVPRGSGNGTTVIVQPTRYIKIERSIDTIPSNEATQPTNSVIGAVPDSGGTAPGDLRSRVSQ